MLKVFNILFLFYFSAHLHAQVIFSWDCESSPVGTLNNGTTGQPFSEINTYDGIVVEISNTYSHSGNRAIKLSYPRDEAGVELQVNGFNTPSLYVRKYEYFASGWEGNWPVGLKTGRYFTNGLAYHSEKMIWQTYDCNCQEQYGLGMNSAIYNLDLEKMYNANEIFENNLPYIRTGHWYKIETWMILNSAPDVNDGVLKIWIDDVPVYDRSDVPWRSNSRGCPSGTAWTNMWFGGNYSGAICGNPSTTVYRYIDDLYMSNTLDRETQTTKPDSPLNFRLE